LQLRVDEWPQGAVLFALGVHAAHAGWLESLPQLLVRRLGWIAIAGAVVLPTMFVVGLGPVKDDKLTTTADVPTLAFALLDGVIAVTWTLWFIAWLRRRRPAHGALVAKAGRAAFATYFIHPLTLTLLMMLFSPLAVIPEIKFVLVSLVAIPTCFAVGYALTRLPGVNKVL
jgi:glucans biosynthesis protein C